MRNKINCYLLISTLVFTLQSCASFDGKLINPNPLNAENLNKLNGRYSVVHLEFDSIPKGYNRQIWTHHNFFKEIDRKLLKDTLKLDSLKTYGFDLEVINTKKIRIDYVENGKVIKERVLKTKLKDDGYLYLKNKNIKFILVPYIAGALDVKKARFTKSKNGNLIFDVSNHRSGAVLLVIFLDGMTQKYRQEYELIE